MINIVSACVHHLVSQCGYKIWVSEVAVVGNGADTLHLCFSVKMFSDNTRLSYER